ncbi:response regulator transcription factor [Noviherbaspirillum aerium]|uniref:response regulator transcription factor n=1 Tax=Noviherbaspirillum aerium TaxID=2588497 RepID=UPI00124E6566|nr:response regulator transcription factor [Noviherbaspirillum aerium]
MRIAFHTKDPDLAEAIRETLSAKGYDCVQLERSRTQSYQDVQICLIDWQAHGNSSPQTMLQQLRRQSPSMPVLALTERNRIEEALAALAAGASDYLVKPIRRNELVLRSEVLLRNAYPERYTQDLAVYGPYCFELRSGRITRDGATLDLTQKEFELALLLFRHLDRPLSRAFIRDAVWSGELEMPSRTMDTHVSRVRSKLGLHPENGFRLAPVYSYGYRLEQLAHPSPQ